MSLPVLEKTCQEYVLNPTKERINLNELPVETVVKSVNVSQEPIRKNIVDNAIKTGKLLGEKSKYSSFFFSRILKSLSLPIFQEYLSKITHDL